MTMSDRIAVMNDGELQQIGTPKEVYFQPTNIFVADFIGSPSINLLDMALDGKSLVHDDFEYEVDNEMAERIRESGSDSLVLGVRPEDVRVVEPENVQPGKNVSMTVDVVETVGSDNFIYTAIGGTEFRLRTSSLIDPDEGTEITITFDVKDIHLFDRHTEDAIFHGSQASQMTTDALDIPESSRVEGD